MWDQETRTCKVINPCFVRTYTPCSAVGTLACVALDMQHPKCICKAEYMGKDCAQLRNACLERFNKVIHYLHVTIYSFYLMLIGRVYVLDGTKWKHKLWCCTGEHMQSRVGHGFLQMRLCHRVGALSSTSI